MSRPQKIHKSKNNELINTRQALLEATLDIVSDGKSFDAISLREVTRAVGVSPAAFYRHFSDMETLGIELVHESFEKLRIVLKSVRTDTEPRKLIGMRSVETLTKFQEDSPLQFRFLARENFGGVSSIRKAIDEHLQVLMEDLIRDLAETPELKGMHRDSLLMIADLMVGVMSRVTSQILTGTKNKKKVVKRGANQLRLIIIGAQQWRDH